MDISRFFSEIQRRHVGRVAGVYAVVGWVVIQVVATVFPLLGISDVAAKVLVVLIGLGFPLAIALAWVFDITPFGLQRTESLSESTPVPATRPRDYGRAMGFFGVGILVAFVAFAALSSVREDGRHSRTAAGIRSIAVLPFVDMSQQQDQTYFTDGITEEVLNRLARIPDLKVPARTASFAYRGTALNVAEIAERLNVEALLEGSVRRDGNQVRVTVRLIDARTQNELWSNDYEKQVSSVFAIQDEIAGDIVDALRLQIDPQPVVAAGMPSIEADPEIVEAYMKGLELWNTRTDAALREAIRFFEQAVAADEDFALGYAMLAQAYAVLPAYGDFPVFEASSKGQAAAARALQLNPNQAEAYAALGVIRQNFEWDFESAERSYRRAILFNNGYATAHQWRAEALLFLGKHEESRAAIDNALDLDPSSASAQYVKAYQHLTRHEFAAASRMLDRVIAAHPDYPSALVARVGIAMMMRQSAAVAALIPRIAGNNQALAAALPIVALAAGDPAHQADAARAIAQLKGRAPSEIALWYALAGLNDQALAAIKAAYDSGADVNLPFLLLNPGFDAIRSTREYQGIMNELHMSVE